MPQDNYPGQSSGINAPSDDFDLIVPDNNNDLPALPKRLWIAADGNLVCHNKHGDSVTIPVLAGQEVPVRPKRVLETTTATVLALF